MTAKEVLEHIYGDWSGESPLHRQTIDNMLLDGQIAELAGWSDFRMDQWWEDTFEDTGEVTALTAAKEGSRRPVQSYHSSVDACLWEFPKDARYKLYMLGDDCFADVLIGQVERSGVGKTYAAAMAMVLKEYLSAR